MARRTRLSPFGQWLLANGYGTDRHPELAKQLKCSEGSIRQWLRGDVPPRAEAIKRLKALTGLPSDAFLFPREWKETA